MGCQRWQHPGYTTNSDRPDQPVMRRPRMPPPDCPAASSRSPQMSCNSQIFGCCDFRCFPLPAADPELTSKNHLHARGAAIQYSDQGRAATFVDGSLHALPTCPYRPSERHTPLTPSAPGMLRCRLTRTQRQPRLGHPWLRTNPTGGCVSTTVRRESKPGSNLGATANFAVTPVTGRGAAGGQNSATALTAGV